MSHPNIAVPAPTDVELIERTRAGDTVAYAELWRRHATAARAAARAFTNSFDPDDLVAEAFTRIFRLIKTGGGPSASFRAYLLTTVRNVAINWSKRPVPVPLDDAEQLADPNTDEVASDARLDRKLIAQAFADLPQRWQQVLWYSEVEGLKPRDIAPHLGLSANSVSALIYRAKEALRQTWIQTHLMTMQVDGEHRWVIERLGSYSRNKLGKREHNQVREHLDSCKQCSGVAAEARRIGAVLPWVLIPLVGSVGAVAQASGATAPSTIAVATRPSRSARAPLSSAARRLIGVGTVAVTSVALLGVAVALTLPNEVSPPAPAATVPVNEPHVPPIAVIPSVQPVPTTSPTDTTTPPTDIINTPDGSIDPEQSRPGSDLRPTPAPSPAAEDPVDVPVPLIFPIDTGDGLWFPVVSGSATPGAQVIVSNGTEPDVQVTAGPTGLWETGQLTGYGAGVNELTARQLGDSASSLMAAATFTLEVPEFTARSTCHSLYVVVVGPRQTTAQLLDQSGEIRGEVTLVIAGRGGYRWEGLFPDWARTADPQTVSARFGSGQRWGPAVTITVEMTDPSIN